MKDHVSIFFFCFGANFDLFYVVRFPDTLSFVVSVYSEHKLSNKGPGRLWIKVVTPSQTSQLEQLAFNEKRVDPFVRAKRLTTVLAHDLIASPRLG